MARVRLGVVVPLVVALLALPAVGGAGAPPASDLDTLLVDGWRQDAGWAVAPVDVNGAIAIGVDLSASPVVQVRAHDGERWGPWLDAAAPGEHLPDPTTREAARAEGQVSEPVWVGAAEEVEVRVPLPAPPALEVTAITTATDRSWTPAGSRAGAAHALSLWPAMVPRSAWDPAGECKPRTAPDVAPSVERVFVHHTAIFPEYQPDEVDDLLRAMCVFHVERRNFDDLGYNFLIDRYGRIYQGRAGGILRAVVGAHASGFNQGSVGIALIGNFDASPPPPAALDALDRLTTWLFEWHGVDPYAVTAHVSTGGATTPHPEGEHVLLPSIVGHRQTATNTSCPGDLLYEHVQGADPAVHRVASRLRDLGVEVGDPVQPPPPQVVPAPEAAPPLDVPTVGRVLEGVVAAVRTLATRRLDERLIPGTGTLPR